MALKLYYFPIRGRGEQIRLLLHTVEVPFDDVSVKRDELMALKKQGPRMLAFGSLPVIEEDGFRLAQGPAIMAYLGRKHDAAPSDARLQAQAEAITLGAEDFRMQYFKLFGDDAKAKQSEFLGGPWRDRWLPNLEGLLALGGSKEHFVGDAMSFADVAIWDVLNAFVSYIEGASLDGFSGLQTFCERFAARPPVAAYIAARPA
jgi:glutathione S-transferase